MNLYQQFIYKSRYARWNEELGRREQWPETVARYFNFFEEHLQDKYGYKVESEQRAWLENMVLSLQVMPSMRALMTAGPALKRENLSGYNCSYLPVQDIRSFDEILYILMNGTGVGFSVEHQYTQKLPSINPTITKSDTTVVVEDSKEGWAKALRELISLLYNGIEPQINTSKVRPAGARLKTFGGRASGPGPLLDLFNFVIQKFYDNKGRKLSTLDCHDIACKIAEVVVVGGVRRSALISLSDLDDSAMRAAKTGQWWINNGQRALANNSAVYNEPPSMQTFMDEWHSLYNSKSGERGIFNRYAAKKHIEKYGRRDPNFVVGSNPCLEILLRPHGLCNLSEVVLRKEDSRNTIFEKIKAATIFGTWQSTLDDFGYVRKKWSDNQIEERLLGVSLTGICDYQNRDSSTWLSEGRKLTVATNNTEAEKIGINPSVATTCVKPSGTVSQLVDAASGIHPRHSDYYIRNVRNDKKDPLTQFLIDHDVPYEDDVQSPNSNVVFSFPVKSPEGSLTRNDLSALEHLQLYQTLQENWCEHKPSVTITVKEEEWLDVGAYVYNNMDNLIGVSFLPHTDHVYRQAPYQDCTKEEYEGLAAKMPKNINWDDLSSYEKEDNTVASQELACAAGFCEII